MIERDTEVGTLYQKSNAALNPFLGVTAELGRKINAEG
jgi:hypothetical protein